MPGDVEPPELARLLDYAERPRTHDWSLRAALVRYASPEPRRVGALIELVRRIEFALQPHLKAVEKQGAAYWQAIESGEASGDVDPYALGLLLAMVELDGLGDAVAAWAVDRAGDRPDTAVDAVIVDVAQRLETLKVPREERVRPPGRRRG